jgi:hypothetical protein
LTHETGQILRQILKVFNSYCVGYIFCPGFLADRKNAKAAPDAGDSSILKLGAKSPHEVSGHGWSRHQVHSGGTKSKCIAERQQLLHRQKGIDLHILATLL